MKLCCFYIERIVSLVTRMESDTTLLNSARMMNKDALVRIFDLYSTALYKYVLRFCGDPILADHIVGDVFAKLLEQLAAGNGPQKNLRSYLYETAYHRLIDEARYSRRRAPLEAAAWLTEEFQFASQLDDRMTYTHVLHAIRTDLTEDQRHVIVLRFLEEFSLLETAAIVGKRVQHVKVIQGRALAMLRKSLENREVRKAIPSKRIRSFPKLLGAN